MGEQQKSNQTEQDLNHVLKARRDKLAELQAAGKDPFLMEKCIEHGSFSTSPLRQVRIKRKGIVRNWFGYAKVHKSDSH